MPTLKKTNYVTNFSNSYSFSYDTPYVGTLGGDGNQKCMNGSWTRITIKGSCNKRGPEYSAFICNNSNPDQTIFHEQKNKLLQQLKREGTPFTLEKYKEYKNKDLTVCPMPFLLKF